MLQYAVLQVAREVSAPATSIARVRSPLAGNITRVEVSTESANGAGVATFDVNVNGTSIFTSTGHRPSLASGASEGFTTSVDAPSVARGDLVTIDAATIPAGGFAAMTLTVTVTIDDGIATTLSGDASGAFSANTVTKVQGNAVDATAPTHEQAYVWSQFAASFVARNLTLTHDDIIADLYWGALARVTTSAELTAARGDFLTNIDASGVAGLIAEVQSLGHTLFTGSEYIARARTDAQFVSDLFQAYLGRNPASAEVTTWTTYLATHTRAQTDAAVSAASEVTTIRLRRVVSSSNRGVNPMTTLGDFIAGGAAGAEGRIGIGSAGQVLTVVSGSPAWATPTAVGMANPMTASGDIIYGGTAGAAQRLAKGSDGQILTLASGLPAWAAAASGAVAPFTSSHPDAHPSSANAADDEFDGSSLDTAGTRTSGATAWAWVNQGSVLLSYSQSHAMLKRAASNSANNVSSIVQSLPSQTFKYRCKMSFATKNADNMAGLVLRDSASSKLIMFQWYSGSSPTLKVQQYTNNTTTGTTSQSVNCMDATLYLEIEQDATNRYYRFSFNGVEGSFNEILSETKTAFLTPDQIGLALNPFSAPCIAAFDWFRRIS
jgi:hypothetical protein